jgi:hypothetical protein
VALKSKLQAVLKRKAKEDSGAGSKEFEDVDPFGMLCAK